MLHPSQLLPVPSHGILRDPDWHYWGGGVLRTDDGTHHLLIARWPRERGYRAWVTHSEIAYATSASPGGPYTVHGTAIGRRENAWDGDNQHNPMPIAWGGRFYCYYTGNFGNGEWWDHRNHQRIGVAVADHPAGPWRRSDRPLLDVTPGSWDHLIANCPVVAIGGDGRFYMVYKGVSAGPMPFGGQVRMGLAMADHPEGPFNKLQGNFFDAPGVQFSSDDNYIWHADGKFHAIVKDYGGHFQTQSKEALVLFESDDCRSWRVAKPNAVLTTFRLRFADGRTIGPLNRLEQPQLIFDPISRWPTTLLLAVKEKDDTDDSDLAYNVQVPLAPPIAL